MTAKELQELSEELLNQTAVTISPAQAAPLIPCSPYNINLAARDPAYRDLLGFPVIVIGNRVRIPRVPFLRFMGLLEGDSPDASSEEKGL